MNRMLASVNCLDEARTVQQIGADIIDLKQPALGALGALDTQLVQTIVSELGGTQPISATVGDLPMQAELISQAVQAMAATGVDYVKIGFFPDQDWDEVISQLQICTQDDLKLIAVLFADQQPNLNTVTKFAAAGFAGVMLDTMDKNNGSLTQVMPLDTIQHFVKLAKQQQLLSGLAGSLRATDIKSLLPLQADYLGFRGALCKQHQRTAELDPLATADIKAALT
ncbi:MAG: (5-formylfuran-3-yl)methyl phosphate synthase [Methyloprofundus sp.]|nr:MAG: (5-formylfuran-3-yl)methyl phosphate synthase [Methyloprofundus sp.]